MGLRQRALLGPTVPRRGQSDPADQSTLRETVRQRIKKRRGGCRSNLRSSVASDHAFCAGQIDRTTGPAVASSCSRPCRLYSYRPYKPYAGTAWRVRGCFAARRLALRRTSARIIGSRAGALSDMLDQLSDLNHRLEKLDAHLMAFCRTNEACRRLSKLPGVGPVIATALVAAVDDGRHFRSGRELAAWIGLVPRQYTTGGKPRLGGIGRRANHYLRRQMIHGARSVVIRLAKHDDRRSQWLKGLAARRGFNRTIVALANKTARIAWALLTRNEDYVAA